MDYGDRRSEGFRSLRQGLGYTLSVVLAAMPDRAGSVLRGLAEEIDPDLRYETAWRS
ncbi:MAG: hypothetical protein AB1331_04025 [Bacillota bacterium]